MAEAMVQMQKLCDLPNGQPLYYADDTFTDPGFYTWDRERQENVRLLIVPDEKPPSPKPLLERLAGELEEIEALLDENRQAAAEQVAHRALKRLREEAEGLGEESCEDPIRDQAVANVDDRNGYTAEFSSDPEGHREEYDAEEERLRAATLPPESQEANDAR